MHMCGRACVHVPVPTRVHVWVRVASTACRAIDVCMAVFCAGDTTTSYAHVHAHVSTYVYAHVYAHVHAHAHTCLACVSTLSILHV